MKLFLLPIFTILLCSQIHAGEVTIVNEGSVYDSAGNIKSKTVYVKIPTAKVKGEVQVKVGRIMSDFPRMPSQALSATLKQDLKSNEFRVSWNGYGSNYGFISTALYNRASKTLKFYSQYTGGQGDTYGKGVQSVFWKNVKDATIHSLATSNRGETLASGPLGPLDSRTAGFAIYLKHYGARVARAT